MLGIFERISEILLGFGYLLERIRCLESLHVLHDTRQFVVFVEVDQFMVR